MKAAWTVALLASVAGLASGQDSVAGSKPPQGKPNVLMIIADDLGYADLGAYTHAAPDIQTPNLDRIADQGALFSHAYVTSPICSPSRVGIMTGRHPFRWGVTTYSNSAFPESTPTLAERLKAEGYRTGMIGKSHYYGTKLKNTCEHPLDHGFDYFYGFLHGVQHYLYHSNEAAELYKGGNFDAGPMWVNRERREEDGYATLLYEREGLDFIDRNRANPFFLCMSFSAVHLFVNELPASAMVEAGIPAGPVWDPTTQPGRGGYMKWYFSNLKRNGDDKTPHDPHGRARYLMCLAYMDRAVGKLLDRLDELGLREDTLVVFLSDNGGSPRTYAINKPLSGYKYDLGEGGIRVPFALSWPKHIAEGAVVATPVSALDIVPTVMAAVGETAEPDLPASDGIDLVAALASPEGIPERPMFWKGGRKVKAAVRLGNFKLSFTGEKKVLHDVVRDPGEQNDLADSMPEKATELADLYKKWEQESRAVSATEIHKKK